MFSISAHVCIYNVPILHGYTFTQTRVYVHTQGLTNSHYKLLTAIPCGPGAPVSPVSPCGPYKCITHGYMYVRTYVRMYVCKPWISMYMNMT